MVVAHPDDAEIMFGATMLSKAEQGIKVFVLVATNGEKSCLDAHVSNKAVARLRRKEQLEAARRAEVSEVFFLDLPDGDLQRRQPRLRERIAYFIRKLKPHALYTFDPTTVYRHNRVNHPDHRAIGEAALTAACFGAGLERYYPEHRRKGLSPWRVEELFLAGSSRANFHWDMRPYLARKTTLVNIYKSQLGERNSRRLLMMEQSMRRIKNSPHTRP